MIVLWAALGVGAIVLSYTVVGILIYSFIERKYVKDTGVTFAQALEIKIENEKLRLSEIESKLYQLETRSGKIHQKHSKNIDVWNDLEWKDIQDERSTLLDEEYIITEFLKRPNLDCHQEAIHNSKFWFFNLLDNMLKILVFGIRFVSGGLSKIGGFLFRIFSGIFSYLFRLIHGLIVRVPAEEPEIETECETRGPYR